MNDTNIDFYRYIKIDKFKELAQITGFDTCKDIDIIYPYIDKADTVLELGAGYGRAINALINKGMKGKLIAVERVPELVRYLRTQIPDSVILQQQDLKQLAINEQPDAVLWLWSGLLELSRDEQLETIRHIAENLKEGGILIVEIPRKVKYVGVYVGDQRIWVETEWGTLEGYLPRHEEMEEFARLSGFKTTETINYNSSTGLDRAIYIMKK